jgi:hypothetical protein
MQHTTVYRTDVIYTPKYKIYTTDVIYILYRFTSIVNVYLKAKLKPISIRVFSIFCLKLLKCVPH